MEGSWVDLLKRNGLESPSKRLPGGAHVRISADTPKTSRVGTNKRAASENQVSILRAQVASLLKEKQELSDRAAEEHQQFLTAESELQNTRRKLQAAMQSSVLSNSRNRHGYSSHDNSVLSDSSYAEVQSLRDALDHVTQEKRALIGQLALEREGVAHTEDSLRQCEANNSDLEKALCERDQQVEGLAAHVKELQAELSRAMHTTTAPPPPPSSSSSSSLSQGRGIIADLERLTQRNAELSAILASTQHSRSSLEREVLGLKRTLLEVRGHCRKLEGELATRGESLEALGRDKEHLATCLQQQKNDTTQLAEEKSAVDLQLQRTQEELASTQEELGTLRNTQLAEIDSKCRDVDHMKTQLEEELSSLAQERMTLASEVAELRRQGGVAEGREKGLKMEVEVLKQEGTTLSNKLDEARIKLQLQANEIIGLKQEGNSLRLEEKSLHDEVIALRKEGESLRDDLASCRHRESNLAHQLEQSEGRVRQSQAQADRLASENSSLQARLGQLESRLDEEKVSFEDTVVRQHEQLDSIAVEFEGTVTELESTRTANMLAQQRISDLERQVTGLTDQVTSRSELTNEMKGLLDQRAARIRQLEKTVKKLRADLNDSMVNSSQDLLNISKDTLDTSGRFETSSQHSFTSVSSTRSQRWLGSSQFTSPQAEVLHFRQRLADSRQTRVKLEVQQASLKTELAKLHGTIEALNTIKQNLSNEVDVLQAKLRSCEDDWREERAQLCSEIDALTTDKIGLSEENSLLLSQQRDLMESEDKDKATVTAKMEARQRKYEEELASREDEIQRLNYDLAEACEMIDNRTRELEKFQQTMQDETSHLQHHTHKCSDDMAVLNAESVQIKDSQKITDAINATRSAQIQERESGLSQLMAEVEVLRARKNIAMKYLVQRELPAGKPCGNCSRLNETLQQAIAEKHHLEERLSQSLVTPACTGKKVDRLRARLKLQVKQTNYLRVKLGYTLAEVRLYKQLKVETDRRLEELSAGLAASQEQYLHCLQRLALAEQLGALDRGAA